MGLEGVGDLQYVPWYVVTTYTCAIAACVLTLICTNVAFDSSSMQSVTSSGIVSRRVRRIASWGSGESSAHGWRGRGGNHNFVAEARAWRCSHRRTELYGWRLHPNGLAETVISLVYLCISTASRLPSGTQAPTSLRDRKPRGLVTGGLDRRHSIRPDL